MGEKRKQQYRHRKPSKQSFTSVLKAQLSRISHEVKAVCSCSFRLFVPRNKQRQSIAYNKEVRGSSTPTIRQTNECATVNDRGKAIDNDDDENNDDETSDEAGSGNVSMVAGGVDERAEEFRSKFYQQLKIQRQDSLEEFLEMLVRSC